MTSLRYATGAATIATRFPTGIWLSPSGAGGQVQAACRCCCDRHQPPGRPGRLAPGRNPPWTFPAGKIEADESPEDAAVPSLSNSLETQE